MQKILDVLHVRPAGEDQFSGPAVPSNIQRTFGGQVAAQALRAAQLTLDEQGDAAAAQKVVHSLHSYFLAPSDSRVPLEISVERLRDGRTYSQRLTRAFQNGQLKYLQISSFRIPRDRGPEHQVAAPDVVAPDQLVPGMSQPSTARVLLGDWDEWDIRMVPEAGRDYSLPAPTGPGFRNIWFRNKAQDLPQDPAVHAAALTYMTDMTLLRASLINHPNMAVQLASLDHTIWFVRPPRVDDWLLYSQDSSSAHRGASLTRGRIFDRAGNLIAEVSQEGLTRGLRQPDAVPGWA